jgi:SMP-30/Gluconolactonase/LRE-like region
MNSFFLSTRKKLAQSIAALSLLAVTGSVFASGAARPDASVKKLVDFPAGTFLENIDVARNGDVYFTSYFEQTVYRYNSRTGSTAFSKIPIHPASVLVIGDRRLVAGPMIPFNKGTEFTATNQLVLLDNKGVSVEQIAVPQARFLNGMTRHGKSKVLIADSILGVIWEFDLRTKKVTEWFKHEILTQDPEVKQFSPAANGVKVSRGSLYVSNSSRGAIYAFKLGSDGRPASNDARLVAKTGSVDDFVVLANGQIIAASHADTLIRISTSGKISNIISTGCGACTAVGFTPGASAPSHVYVTTTGHMLEGGKEGAYLLRVTLPR